MSSLKNVTELLQKGCFCHSNELKYMFEYMPPSIPHNKNLSSDCAGNISCYHKQEKEIKQALEQFKTFLETESKFKVGDRVELAITPVINSVDSWGWLGSKHFLIEGAKGIVREINYYNNTFVYAVEFDDESWIDSKGVVQPTSTKHTYAFKESSLRKTDSFASYPADFLRKLWSDFHKVGD